MTNLPWVGKFMVVRSKLLRMIFLHQNGRNLGLQHSLIILLKVFECIEKPKEVLNFFNFLLHPFSNFCRLFNSNETFVVWIQIFQTICSYTIHVFYFNDWWSRRALEVGFPKGLNSGLIAMVDCTGINLFINYYSYK